LSGCSFAGRCSDRMAICDSKQPVLFEISAAQSARCFKHEVEA
jgi:ABC-type dipeptide/oligopeptide/nickel transport system ATPase component